METKSPPFLAAAASGFRIPFEALRLLRRERRLWSLAAAPLALSVAALSLGLVLFLGNAGEIYTWVAGWLPTPEAGAWYAWLWVGPVWLLLKSLGWALFLALGAACVVASLLVASLLAAPFHDALARRVEWIVTGGLDDDRSEAGLAVLLREGRRALVEEARRLAFFAVVMAPLFAAGWVIPGAALVTGPAMTLFVVLFLPLDYASYTLDRRGVAFREKRRWVLAHAPAMLGFGVAAFATFLVPGLNLLAMPLLVVGGTLLALRHPLEALREV